MIPGEGRAGEILLDRENDLFQVLSALKSNRRKRSELGELFVEGVAPIKAAAKAGLEFARFVFVDYGGLSDWAKGLVGGHPEASRICASREIMAKLSDREEGSEIVATVRKRDLDLSEARLPDEPFVLVMDRPSNHGNLGSILRSCDAFGVDLVVTTGHGVDLFDPAVIRASLGAVFTTQALHEESSGRVEAWLSGLKAADPSFRIVGTDSGSSVGLAEARLARPLALLLGNEAKGLSVRLKAFVDQMVMIPMTGAVDSLNVACAASIFIYEVFSRDLAAKGEGLGE
jgi:23S rRNA (uridine2479-2'-O)-methyltransferase